MVRVGSKMGRVGEQNGRRHSKMGGDGEQSGWRPGVHRSERNFFKSTMSPFIVSE